MDDLINLNLNKSHSPVTTSKSYLKYRGTIIFYFTISLMNVLFYIHISVHVFHFSKNLKPFKRFTK